MLRRSGMPLVTLALALAAISSPAFAHIGGHAGGFTHGLAHPFYGLDHVLAMVAVGIWATQLGRPALWLLPTTFPIVMGAAFALGVAGVPLPWAEIGIAASVLLLGAAIAFALRPSLVGSVALIGLFALFHGHAHGAELPPHGTAVTYGLGLVLATLVLHSIGIAIGMIACRPAGRIAMRAAGGAIAAAGLVLLILR
jgi:urease accessory protein